MSYISRCLSQSWCDEISSEWTCAHPAPNASPPLHAQHESDDCLAKFDRETSVLTLTIPVQAS